MNNIVALYAGHSELEELPLAAGFFEGSKVFLAVSDRVIMVALAVEPDRWPIVAPTACKECLIDEFGDGTPSHEIDDTQSLLGMHSYIGDRQQAAT